MTTNDPEKFEELHNYGDGLVYLQCRKCSHKFEINVVTEENLTKADGVLHPVCPECRQHTLSEDQVMNLDVELLEAEVRKFFTKHVRDTQDVVLQITLSPNNQHGVPEFRMLVLGIQGPHDLTVVKTLKSTEAPNDYHTDPPRS